MRKFLLLLPLALALSGCLSLQSDNSKVLARFDGTVVTENQFLKKVRGLPKVIQTAAMDRRYDLVQDMAAEHFLLKEALRRGVDKDPDVKDLLEVARKKILIARLLEKEVDEKILPDDPDIAKYYDFHKEEFMTPLLFRASLILVKTEEEANAIRSQIGAGGDFQELARQHSLDATAIRGGDLGFFQKGQFVPEFEEVVSALKKNEVSAPVKTAFGYYIIRLEDRAEPRLREFKTVKSLARERFVNERRSRLFKSLVEKLKGNVKVNVDEKALEAVSLDSAGGKDVS